MLHDFEQFLVAAGKDAITSKQYRQALARVFRTVEDRGLQVNSSAAAAALKELPGIKWETKESAAIGCLEEFYRARESPERYSEETSLLSNFNAWLDGLGAAKSTTATRRSAVHRLLRLLRERGLAVPKNAADVKGLQLSDEKPIPEWQRIAVKQLALYLEQASAPTAAATGFVRQKRTRKQPSVEEHGQGSSSGGRVVAACLGPKLKETDTVEVLGEELDDFRKESFFVGDNGRYRLVPSAEQHNTLALALSCAEGDGAKQLGKDILTGFECYHVACGSIVNRSFFGHGDLMFRDAMSTAVMAVRLRARSICRLLGVEDVDEAVKRLCDAPCRSQLILIAQPRGLKKTGPSAGLAAALSVVAMMTGRRLKRWVASTGGITLSGAVTRIGGLDEKLDMARENGIRTVILPVGDLRELRQQQKTGGGEQALELIGVQSLEDAINAAFEDVGMDESGAAQQRADETAEEMEEEGESAGAAAVAQDGSETEGQREVAPWIAGRSRLEMDEGVYWGAAQSVTWRVQDGKMISLAVEVEVILHPGIGDFTATNYLNGNGVVDIITVCVWLSKHQQHIRPREGKGFLLPNFAEQLENLDVTTKVNPSGELTERHLAVAVAVAMVAAITGYRYNTKACVVGSMTGDGLLCPMNTVNELDVLVMLASGVEVVVVAEQNIEAVLALRGKYARLAKSLRFVGVKTVFEALPLLLLDYQSPSSLDQVASLTASVPSAPLSESVAHEPQARKRPREQSEEQPDAGKRLREEEGGQGGSSGGAADMMEMKESVEVLLDGLSPRSVCSFVGVKTLLEGLPLLLLD